MLCPDGVNHLQLSHPAEHQVDQNQHYPDQYQSRHFLHPDPIRCYHHSVMAVVREHQTEVPTRGGERREKHKASGELVGRKNQLERSGDEIEVGRHVVLLQARSAVREVYAVAHAHDEYPAHQGGVV